MSYCTCYQSGPRAHQPKKAKFAFMAGSRSSAPSTLRQRLRQRLRRYNWRPAAGLAAGSLVGSVVLVGYLFGFSDHFFARLFSTYLVLFWLLAFTFLAAVPFVGWAAANWFGRGWVGASPPARRAGSGASAAAPRRTAAPARVRAPESYS